MRVVEGQDLTRIVDVAMSTGVPILAPQWPSSQHVAPCQWHGVCGVIGAHQGWQDVHKMSGPAGRHVAMNHALQHPSEALFHGKFDVIILAGDEVYVPGLEQSLEGHCTHFSALVPLHSQRRSILHVVQNGLHVTHCLSAVLAGQSSCPGVFGKHVYAAEEIPVAVVGLSALAAVHQVAL